MAENFFPYSSSSSPSVPPSIEGGQSSSGPENPTRTGFYPQSTPRFKWTPDLQCLFLEADQLNLREVVITDYNARTVKITKYLFYPFSSSSNTHLQLKVLLAIRLPRFASSARELMSLEKQGTVYPYWLERSTTETACNVIQSS
nr:transcription activator GLK2-like isoform X3 [Ipomoea batatas]